MSKKIILLGLGGLAAGMGGSGFLGHRIGMKSGADRMGTAMSAAFTEQNAVENAAIKSNLSNRFNAFNANENKIIASRAYQAGQKSMLARILGGGQMAKTSSAQEDGVNEEHLEKIAQAAYADEMEKLSGKYIKIGKKVLEYAKKGGKKIIKSFKSAKGVAVNAKDYTKASRGAKAAGKSTSAQMPHLKAKMKAAGNLKKNLKGSALAASLTGGAAGGYAVGKKGKKRTVIVKHVS